MGRQHASEITTPSPADQLADELQSLKNLSGLTYVRLSERTHYAKSSWERWVNGKQFPPRDAVQSIASVCGGDVEHLLELWHLAESRRVTFLTPGAPAPGGEAPGTDPADGPTENGPLRGGPLRNRSPEGGPGEERSADCGPTEEAHAECPHRREATLLKGLALVSLALGAGGVLVATGRRGLRREV
ncbi:helix-turn-helix domain-containing protein [Kitasatospora sp. NPDC127059]|uniref:helix-turn-helix domain-containing protein n=1 Tax=unclassified Kitasatospora TaxID=2633591 RepID=UPI00364CA197